MKPTLKYTISSDSLVIDDVFELPKYTIVVGKNNSGKSWFLTSLYKKLRTGSEPEKVYYISPERFGQLQRNSNLEDASHSSNLQRDMEKLKNQSSDFITESISKFNGLIAQLNRTPNAKNGKIKDKFLENLNNKIVNIEFSYTSSEESTPFHFKINNKYINPEKDRFSSGTNQMIALMTSVMYFLYSKKYKEDSILLLDEPDVHIHPDLQIQFINFLISITNKTKHKVVIATHSSSIISGFTNSKGSFIGIKNDMQSKLDFYEVNDYIKNILPSLGSHSLSHVFNKAPLLLVEGEDDELVWQYAIRNSGNKKLIKFHIINTTSKSEMKKYEFLINQIASQLFDDPRVYEIRDRDNVIGNLEDKGCISRSFLDCNEIENLILSNEVLKELGYSSLDEALSVLKNQYTSCRSHGSKNDEKCKMCKFIYLLQNSIVDRFTADLKGSENKILSILSKGQNRLSLEILVGKIIGKNILNKHRLISESGSVYNMLGNKISTWLG